MTARAEDLEEVARLQTGRAVGDRHHRDDQREPAELQQEVELLDELGAVGKRRSDRGQDRLAGQDHHVPDLLQDVLDGQICPLYRSSHLCAVLAHLGTR
jgi:hypothetical protein